MSQSKRNELDKKIVDGLERIADIIKYATWQICEPLKLSPIQIKILNHILEKEKSDIKISSLAEEFLVSKPTITDSVKALQRRELVTVKKDSIDKRCSFISLSAMGKIVAKSVSENNQMLLKTIQDLNSSQKESFFITLINVIHSLQIQGFIPLQRMCFSCKYHSLNAERHYCSLLEKELKVKELKISCPEHQAS